MNLANFLDNLSYMPKTEQQSVGVVILQASEQNTNDDKLENKVVWQKLLDYQDERFVIVKAENGPDLKHLCQSAEKTVLCMATEKQFEKLDLSGLGSLVFRFSA